MIKESYHWTDEYTYIFDSTLNDLLQANHDTKKQYIHTGLNVTTHQQFWQYKSSGEVSEICVALEEQAKGKRLSIDRWKDTRREMYE